MPKLLLGTANSSCRSNQHARGTILTRITGDAGLKRQPLALVPVGAIGIDELTSVMSQYVTEFIRESDVFIAEGGDRELNGVVLNARNNVYELFSRFRLHGNAKRGGTGFSFARPEDAGEFFEQVSSPVLGLVSAAAEMPELPQHVYCTGPMFLENWREFDKREVFSFEGWETATEDLTRQLFGQLRRIDEQRRLPAGIRNPAMSLYRLLARERPGAANEFSTMKELKSRNTWIVVPIAYTQFMTPINAQNERTKVLAEPELWRDGLGRAIATNADVMPAIPRYDGFPWVAGICHANPLKLDVVFDDRYFMASTELNLLNTLLLAEQAN